MVPPRALSEREKKQVAYRQEYRCAACDCLLPPTYEVDVVQLVQASADSFNATRLVQLGADVNSATVTGRTALLGPEFAQQYRCLVLDWFFRFFPFLGSGLHYDILVPLHAWFLGDVATVQLLLSLAIAFFACNALKDLLMLPRPRASVREGPGDGVVALETSYLEEYGFPSTHAAAGVVWSRALCELLRKPPLLAGLSTLFGAAISSPSSAGGFRSSPQVAVAEDSAVLQLVAKHAPSVAAAYASLVSFSRLYLGVHSLLDLAGGLTIGVCSIALVDFFVMPAFMEALL